VSSIWLSNQKEGERRGGFYIIVGERHQKRKSSRNRSTYSSQNLYGQPKYEGDTGGKEGVAEGVSVKGVGRRKKDRVKTLKVSSNNGVTKLECF